MAMAAAATPRAAGTKLDEVVERVMEIAHDAARRNPEALKSFCTNDSPNANALDTQESVDLCHEVYYGDTCFEFLLRHAGEGKSVDLTCVRCMLEKLRGIANALPAGVKDERPQARANLKSILNLSDAGVDKLLAYTYNPITSIADILTEFKEKLSPKFPQTRWGADIVALIFPDTTVLVSKAFACEIALGLLCLESVVTELASTAKSKLHQSIKQICDVGALQGDYIQTVRSCINAIGAKAYNNLRLQLPAGLIRAAQREQAMKALIKFYEDCNSKETGFARGASDYTRQRAFVTLVENLPMEYKVPAIAALFGAEERVTMESSGTMIVHASARHYLEKIISYETLFVLDPFNTSGFHLLWLECMNAYRTKHGDAVLPPSPTVRNPTAVRQLEAKGAGTAKAAGNARGFTAPVMGDLDDDSDLDDDLPKPHIPEGMSQAEKRELLIQHEQDRIDHQKRRRKRLIAERKKAREADRLADNFDKLLNDMKAQADAAKAKADNIDLTTNDDFDTHKPQKKRDKGQFDSPLATIKVERRLDRRFLRPSAAAGGSGGPADEEEKALKYKPPHKRGGSAPLRSSSSAPAALRGMFNRGGSSLTSDPETLFLMQSGGIDERAAAATVQLIQSIAKGQGMGAKAGRLAATPEDDSEDENKCESITDKPDPRAPKVNRAQRAIRIIFELPFTIVDETYRWNAVTNRYLQFGYDEKEQIDPGDEFQIQVSAKDGKVTGKKVVFTARLPEVKSRRMAAYLKEQWALCAELATKELTDQMLALEDGAQLLHTERKVIRMMNVDPDVKDKAVEIKRKLRAVAKRAKVMKDFWTLIDDDLEYNLLNTASDAERVEIDDQIFSYVNHVFFLLVKERVFICSTERLHPRLWKLCKTHTLQTPKKDWLKDHFALAGARDSIFHYSKRKTGGGAIKDAKSDDAGAAKGGRDRGGGGGKKLTDEQEKQLRSNPETDVGAYARANNLCVRCGSADHNVTDCPIARNPKDRTDEDKETLKPWSKIRRKIRKANMKAKKRLLAGK